MPRKTELIICGGTEDSNGELIQYLPIPGAEHVKVFSSHDSHVDGCCHYIHVTGRRTDADLQNPCS